MPIVQVDWLKIGQRDDELKQKLFSGIAKAFEDIGIDKAHVHIILRDIPTTDWAVGDNPMSERFR